MPIATAPYSRNVRGCAAFGSDSAGSPSRARRAHRQRARQVVAGERRRARGVHVRGGSDCSVGRNTLTSPPADSACRRGDDNSSGNADTREGESVANIKSDAASSTLR
jgi:hypothetical protein